MKVGALCLALLAAGCTQPVSDGDGLLTLERPRVQLNPGDTAALYLAIVNRGAAPDRLLRVETPAARSAEIHETVVEGGVVRMLPRPEGFEIPAGETLELAHGGKHVMLLGARPDTARGAVRLTLHFEAAGPVEVEAVVVPAGSTADHSAEGEGHAGG